MSLINIYELVDPRVDVPRYVGKARTTLKDRLKAHCSSAKNGRNIHRYAWIRSLLRDGVKPEIKLIDQVPESEWQFWEKHYISLYRSWGFDLTNLTDGGDGITNLSKEIRDKISKSKTGRKLTEEHKRKISLAGIGRSCSLETRLKRSESVKLSYAEGRKVPNIRRGYSRKIIIKNEAGVELDVFDQMIYLIRSDRYKYLNLNRGTVYIACNTGKIYKGFKFAYG